MDILKEQEKSDLSELTYIKTPEQIAKMREAGRICAEILNLLGDHIKPGVTTRQLDKLAHDLIVDTYQAEVDRTDLEGFSYADDQSVFFTLNNVIARGTASDEPLQHGDILGIDMSIKKDGWCGDTSALARRLLSVAYEAMKIGIENVRPGVHLGTAAHAVQSYVESQGFSMVRCPGLTGHTIGQVHCEGLLLPFYGEPGTGHVLQKGMVITIEPFMCAGSGAAEVMPNSLRSARTQDNSLAAFWEHVVAVTDTGCEVLDLRPGEHDLQKFRQQPASHA